MKKLIIILLAVIFTASDCDAPRYYPLINIDDYLEHNVAGKTINQTEIKILPSNPPFLSTGTTTVMTTDDGQTITIGYDECGYNYYGVIIVGNCPKWQVAKVPQFVRDEKITELKKENDMRHQVNLINGYGP